MVRAKSVRSIRSAVRNWSELARARVFVLEHGPLEFRWRSCAVVRRRAFVGAALLALACFGRALRAEELARGQAAPEATISFRLQHRGFADSPPSSADGCRLLLRYTNESRYYEASINRRDNTVALRKRSGQLYLLTPEIPHAVPYDAWQNLRAVVHDRADGSVELALYSSDILLASAIDDGSVGGVPLRDGRVVSLRAENVRARVAGFAVRSTDALAASTEPKPAIAALWPASVKAGSDATDVSVEGMGFSPKSVVRWNGAPRPAFRQGDGRLIIRLSPDDLAVPGTVPVTVSNPGAPSSNALAFKIEPGNLNAEVSRQ